jgi:hypothetical protein
METEQNFKQERLDICKACPQSEYTFGVGLTCGSFVRPVSGVSCGCKLTWKTALKNQQCPQDKWMPILKKEPETETKDILKNG